MSWFRYYKDESSASYSYPFNRRKIKRFKPKDDILKDSWLFVDVSNYSIGLKSSSSFQEESDPYSYLVVYQDLIGNNSFTPVKTVIVGNLLYFQAAEDHVAESFTRLNYVVYYNTPNIRTIYSYDEDFVLDATYGQSEFLSSADDVNDNLFNIDLGYQGYYNFSFDGSGWSNGTTKQNGSSALLTFSGPSIRLFGNTSPKGKSFRYKIIPVDLDTENLAVYNEYVVDTYSSSFVKDQLLIQQTNLSYKDYRLEIYVIDSINSKSSNVDVSLSSYSFSYNVYAILDEEEYDSSISFFLIGGAR